MILNKEEQRKIECAVSRVFPGAILAWHESEGRGMRHSVELTVGEQHACYTWLPETEKVGDWLHTLTEEIPLRLCRDIVDLMLRERIG